MAQCLTFSFISTILNFSLISTRYINTKFDSLNQAPELELAALNNDIELNATLSTVNLFILVDKYKYL